MTSPTNSQIVQQYVLNTYPCIEAWLNFVNTVVPRTLQYDSVSCFQLSLISRAAMKVLDYIVTADSNCNVIRVSRMMTTLQDTAWRCWTSFSAQSKTTSGTRSVAITPVGLQALSSISSWDCILDDSPTFDPPSLFNLILGEVTV